MHPEQRSDWLIDQPDSSTRRDSAASRSPRPIKNAWEETNLESNHPTESAKSSRLRPLAWGGLIGALIGGIALATVLALWLTSKTTTTPTAVSVSVITIALASTSTLTSVTTITLTSTSSSTSATTTTTASSSTSATTITTTSSSTSATTTSTTISTSSATTSTSSATTTSSTTSTTASTTTSITSTTTQTTATTATTTTTTSGPNLLINPGAEAGVLSPWVVGGGGTPTIDDGTVTPSCSPYSGTKQFYGGYISSGSFSTLTQTVVLLNGMQGYTAAQLDSGTLTAYINFEQQSYPQLFGTDNSQISVDFRSLNSTLIFTNSTNHIACTSNWCYQSATYPVPIGTRSISYSMIFWWVTGSYIDAYFDNNSLQVY